MQSCTLCKKNDYCARIQCLRNDQGLIGWHSLQERRAMSRLTLLYKKVHGLVDVDPSKVVNSGRVTRRSTSQHRFRNIMANKNCYRSSFFSWTVHKWNNLPDHLCSCHSVETFRTQLAQEIDITVLIPGVGGGGGGWQYLGQVLLGMCRWPLRNPTPL